MKRFFYTQTIFLLSFFIISIYATAQIPTGYYDGTENLEETALRAALHDIIDNHYSYNYGQLYDLFEQTDKKPNGKVWDMYSDVPGGTPPYEYTFGSDECGNYNSEGDCYNKEHSWPKSWFGGKKYPMYSDLFHIVPTDGYVNNRRANYPFGEVENATWTSQNGSKVGSCNFPGYSGTVFEPIDEYKGDLARGMFYMSTRYYGEDNNWPGSPMTNGADLKPWAIELLLKWHKEDPVSQKEIDRCNAIFNLQENRNPFIDHPEFAEKIWDPSFGISETEDYKQAFDIYTQNNILNINILDPAYYSTYTCDIYTLQGAKIWEENITDTHNKINIPAVANKACYILVLSSKQQQQNYYFKFIK